MTEFTINDKTYDSEKISDQAKYLLSQVQSTLAKLRDLKREIDLNQIAHEGFKNLLAEELEKEEGV